MMLSVLMITYNHENYIRQAIESVLMQQVNFEIELIIANDNSPDQSNTIINDIIMNHPLGKCIKYINRNENIGMQENFLDAYNKSSGKYIALCEGDDYWTDPFKLQKQVDFLENNQAYVLAFHQVGILKPDGKIVEDFITEIPNNYEDIETLARFGNYIHTPSVVFRNVIKECPFEFSKTLIGDFFLYMMLAQHGKLVCLEEKMAVYRFGVGVHSGNSSIKMAKNNMILFSALLSYFDDENIKKIFLERQIQSIYSFEALVRNDYKEYFISKNIFFKCLKIFIHNIKRLKKLVGKRVKKYT